MGNRIPKILGIQMVKVCPIAKCFKFWMLANMCKFAFPKGVLSLCKLIKIQYAAKLLCVSYLCVLLEKIVCMHMQTSAYALVHVCKQAAFK